MRNIVLAIDSTGIKVANRGEWMRQKWHMKRGFPKNSCWCRCKNKKDFIIENYR